LTVYTSNPPSKILAVIPARGGSKSIPRKNIRHLAGHPLIAYSIAAGLQSRSVNRVVVSTDDDEIAEVARAYGAETPFMRPPELAQDHTTDFPVFVQALDWLQKNEGYRPDIVIQLRPTSPIRPTDCVDQAVQSLLDHPQADSVRGVVPSGQNPYKMWRFAPDGRMVPLLDLPDLSEPYNSPRQMLPQTYWQTGHIDVIRTETILEKKSLSGDAIYPWVIDPRYSVDIDNLRDWQRTEWLIAEGSLDMVYPGKKIRLLPDRVDLIVFDFDGVFTDNRVWVDETGRESVAAYRSDSLILAQIRNAGMDMVVLSTEINPVVSARCQKMKIQAIQSVENKAQVLRQLIADRSLDPAHVIYLGNDINDVPCFPLVGCAVVVSDALPEAIRHADLVLSKPGGHGAVRELCDMLLNRKKMRSNFHES
jgi:YrbI family 3-deoxy-D-manno-octulosonate 8-phosphate phosphatase